MQRENTYYDDLNVSRNASPEVIKAAYKILAKKYHPDKNPNNAQAERMMKKINVAYRTLSNSKTRAEYDEYLNRRDSSSSSYHRKTGNRDRSSNGFERKETKSNQYERRKQESKKENNQEDVKPSVNFWSINSRLTRRKYLIAYIPVIIVYTIIEAVLPSSYSFNLISILLLIQSLFVIIVLRFFLVVKRLHDCDLSGWWSFVPLIDIFIMFKTGTDGTNRFGVNPRENINQHGVKNTSSKKDSSIALTSFIALAVGFIVILNVMSKSVNDNNYYTENSYYDITDPELVSNEASLSTRSSQDYSNEFDHKDKELLDAEYNYNQAVKNINKVWNSFPSKTQDLLREEQRSINKDREELCKQQSLDFSQSDVQNEIFRYKCEVELLDERASYLKLNHNNLIEKTYADYLSLEKAKDSYNESVEYINEIWNKISIETQESLRLEQRQINKDRENFCKEQSSNISGNPVEREIHRYRCEIELLDERAEYLETEYASIGDTHKEEVLQNLPSNLPSSDNLESLISKESIKTINFLTKESEGYDNFNFKLVDKQIIYADLNNDGIKDAVTGLLYCETSNCHMTTRTFDLVVYIGKGNDTYNYADSKPLGLDGLINIDSDGVIRTSSAYYGDEDPSCCPTGEVVRNFKLEDSSLVEVH